MKVIIGRAHLNEADAHKIGADGYAADAGRAASMALQLMGRHNVMRDRIVLDAIPFSSDFESLVKQVRVLRPFQYQENLLHVTGVPGRLAHFRAATVV